MCWQGSTPLLQATLSVVLLKRDPRDMVRRAQALMHRHRPQNTSSSNGLAEYGC